MDARPDTARQAGTGLALGAMGVVAATGYIASASGIGTWPSIGAVALCGIAISGAFGAALMGVLRRPSANAATVSRLMAGMGAALLATPIAALGVAAFG